MTGRACVYSCVLYGDDRISLMNTVCHYGYRHVPSELGVLLLLHNFTDFIQQKHKHTQHVYGMPYTNTLKQPQQHLGSYPVKHLIWSCLLLCFMLVNLSNLSFTLQSFWLAWSHFYRTYCCLQDFKEQLWK